MHNESPKYLDSLGLLDGDHDLRTVCILIDMGSSSPRCCLRIYLLRSAEGLDSAAPETGLTEPQDRAMHFGKEGGIKWSMVWQGNQGSRSRP